MSHKERPAYLRAVELDTLSKIEMYKTAYCPLHRFYVGIRAVKYDDGGRPLIYARPQSSDREWVFRMGELTDFCL